MSLARYSDAASGLALANLDCNSFHFWLSHQTGNPTGHELFVHLSSGVFLGFMSVSEYLNCLKFFVSVSTSGSPNVSASVVCLCVSVQGLSF